jgi:hypothetical protein
MQCSQRIPYKQVLSKKSFLVHLCMTYSEGLPLAVGLLEANQGADGWKMQAKEWEPYLQQSLLDGTMDEDTYFKMMSCSTEGEAPEIVFDTLVKSFPDDLAALDKDTPPVISDRVSRILTVIYAFTDASGLGFGDTFLIKGNIEYTIGVWGKKEAAQSSNYIELCNTMDAIERHAVDGKLEESAIYFCTNNSTMENALYHGRSKESRSLHELVVRLKVLEAH